MHVGGAGGERHDGLPVLAHGDDVGLTAPKTHAGARPFFTQRIHHPERERRLVAHQQIRCGHGQRHRRDRRFDDLEREGVGGIIHRDGDRRATGPDRERRARGVDIRHLGGRRTPSHGRRGHARAAIVEGFECERHRFAALHRPFVAANANEGNGAPLHREFDDPLQSPRRRHNGRRARRERDATPLRVHAHHVGRLAFPGDGRVRA